MTTLREASVPAVGWIIIPLGMVLTFVAPRLLYLLMVFAIPFSATAVINFGSAHAAPGSEAFGLQAAIFLGSLWLGRELFDKIRNRSPSVPPSMRRSTQLVGGFLAVAAVSLVMPAIIDGRFLVRQSETSQSFTPLFLVPHYFTQALYLFYGGVVAVAVAVRSTNLDWRWSTVKAYVAGGVGLAVWGWIQLVVVTTGHSYPRDVLNTNIQPETQGSEEVLHLSIGTVHRISSAAVEPSIFAQFELTTIALLAVMVLRGPFLFSRRIDIAALILMTSITLLSAASTAYVGAAFLAALVFTSLGANRQRRIKYVLAVSGAGLVGVVLYLVVPWVHAVIHNTVFAKTDTWSSGVRLAAVKDAWWHFVDYPILGTGWGTAPNKDLVVFLLASTGAIGFIVFLALVVQVLGQLRVASPAPESAGDGDVALALAIRTALITVLFISILTGFAFVFGHVWLLVGLAIACGSVLKTTTGQTMRAADLEQALVRAPTSDKTVISLRRFVSPRAGWSD